MEIRFKSADERAASDRALESARLEWHWKRRPSLQTLEGPWRRFVLQVEQSFEEDLIEYEHQLSWRDTLQDIIDQVPFSIGQQIREHLARWDDRFRLATVAGEESVDIDEVHRGRWWYRRIPRRGGDLVKAELRLRKRT